MNRFFYYLILIIIAPLLSVVEANIEKETLTSTSDVVPVNIINGIEEWAKKHALVTLRPPYAIQRYEMIVPFPNAEISSVLQSGDKERWYILDELDQRHTYEARISYAASSPTEFVMDILGIEETAAILKERGVLEELADHKDAKVNTTRRVLRVRAIYAGVSIVPGRESQAIKYNIVLETLTYGIPYVAIKLVIVLVAIIGVSLFLIVPSVWKVLQTIRELEEVNQKLE
ncbi:388_t:CDS:2 [Paraglomus occultum]|uniref:388_t:CDS:1 n=1 Tax=Paraglomus occultum TaxID=144539 RepID=A0A9N9AIM9_9GLOM|nr:388_t:CDS:2 [Paraglomus occultum]